jgi:hypothetical protein
VAARPGNEGKGQFACVSAAASRGTRRIRRMDRFGLADLTDRNGVSSAGLSTNETSSILRPFSLRLLLTGELIPRGAACSPERGR